MDLKRMLCATSIAAGFGMAGLLGAGIATANATPAPGNAPVPAANGTPAPAPSPSIGLDHHDRKKVLKQDKKELKHHPAQVTPTSSHS